MYQYFNIQNIRKSLEITYANDRSGLEIYQNGELKIDEVYEGYPGSQQTMLEKFRATAIEDGVKFPVEMVISRNQVFSTDCRCEKCLRSARFFGKKSRCKYMAAILYAIEDYLKEHSIGDATDKKAAALLEMFSVTRTLGVLADVESNAGSLRIVPRLQSSSGYLNLSFKVGDSKLFVIKDLEEFDENVRYSATAVFGKNTRFNLQPGNFDERGKKWISLISRFLQDDELAGKQAGYPVLSEKAKKAKNAQIELYGWRLDEFYQAMEEEAVEREYTDRDVKKSEMIRRKEKNPQIKMVIRPLKEDGSREFHGVEASFDIPVFYRGSKGYYFIDNGYLCKVDEEWTEKINMLKQCLDEDELSIQVGRKQLNRFYYGVLPALEDILQIEELESEEIHKYLLPDVEFVFYLDTNKNDMMCRIAARYGETEYSVLDAFRREEDSLQDTGRMLEEERNALIVASHYFPEVDEEKDELISREDPDGIYDFLESGMERLAQIGEIRATNRFRNLHIIKKPKVSLGVSVSQGLLDLKVDTDEIEADELKSLLKSLRLRKKYYRLKNGTFIHLEDNNLDMLSEMMDALHLSEKDLAGGELHLPIYRSLYLDKLLEENESVYTSRDSHFKEIVKNFRAVSDANFDEPDTLKSVLRSYQKKGYKWLRTLESYGFGGILADDMGLGKTLQTIAVLLAAKKEGRVGASLIVCPASLVYNWEEELHRFAPDLKVLAVTGTIEERKEKIEECYKYDVVVTSYDLLKRDVIHYEYKEFYYQIIDEAQFIKNHSTAASKAVKVIKSRVRYALTGTPIENRLSELWSIFDYLMPGFLYSYDVFKREFETPIVRGEDPYAMKRLQRMVGPFILRRLKSNVLKDLPEKLEETRYVRLQSEQQKLYDAQILHMKTFLKDQSNKDFQQNRFRILAELTRLRQICCDPSLCFENYKGESAKLLACMELVESAIDGGHKILLFSQFTSMLAILQKELEARQISFYVITGETPKESRGKLVKAFNEDDTHVFLISLKAGGVGLNLTGADVVIHYDPWWNVAVQNQATDRAHRIGQQKKVTVYKMIVSHSVEEKIEVLQNTKRDLADRIIEEGQSSLSTMTREDLMELLE